MAPPKYVPMDFPKLGVIESKMSENGTTDQTVTWNHFLTVQDITNDKAPLINLPSHIKVAFAVIMTVSILIGSFFKCIVYVYVSTTNKKRPINTLIIASAIIHHTTHLVSGTWYILVLLMDIPLGDFFGKESCHVMMSIAVYGLIYLSVGSLGISVYRLLYIKQELFVKYIIGENVLLFLVLSFSLVLTGVATELYMAQETGEKTVIKVD